MTIADVAARAGVSTATVSRVLAGSDRVSPETRARVQRVIRELDYRPSAVARSLRRRTTAILGLIVTDITNPFYPELVRGVEDQAQRDGYSVLLCNGAGDPEREIGYLELMLERRVDAVIIASGGLTLRQADWLTAFPIPVVLANVASPDGRLPAVISDNRRGGRLAARHLLECGYPQLVHIAGPRDADGTSSRLEGVEEEAGELLVVEGEGNLAGGGRAMRHALERLRPPFGVAAHNDLSAIGALSMLAESGVGVPGQVGVVGFDDIALSSFVHPPLTTVAQDKYGMGARAADLARRVLGGEQVAGTEVLPVELVVRRSTAPVEGGR